MARPGVDHAKVLRKFVLFALIAQPFHMLAFGMAVVPLNVLWTFVVAVGAFWRGVKGREAFADLLVVH